MPGLRSGRTIRSATCSARGLAEYRHQIAKIGKPVDRGEWWMTPQTVNAVNLPLQNALNFPAAILRRRSTIRRPIRPPITARSAR